MVTGVFLITFLLLLSIENRNIKRDRLRMEKMRNGKMYEDLYPFVRRLRRRRLEEVVISSEEVVFLILLPVRRKIIFSFEGHKHLPLTNNGVAILGLLLQNDISVLRDRKRYYFRRKYDENKNGEKLLIYTYTMKTEYKDALCRNPFYSEYLEY